MSNANAHSQQVFLYYLRNLVSLIIFEEYYCFTAGYASCGDWLLGYLQMQRKNMHKATTILIFFRKSGLRNIDGCKIAL